MNLDNHPEKNHKKKDVIATTMVNPDKIYVREIKGFFQQLRAKTLTCLFALFFLVDWLTWDGRQAVLFDLPERKFHIFFITFWPQDFTLLALLLIIAAFTLFAVTNFAGRLWCGYTCPQTAWTFIFMWIEEHIEGSRNRRIKLDNQPWNKEKIFKKSSKHFLWLLVSFITGLTFVGYFYGIRELIPDLFTGSIHNWALFWTLFFTFTTYGAAGFMREQLCFFCCPYARFQAVMFDTDTLLVCYDKERGEGKSGRGPRKKTDDKEALGLGDCVDCDLCVQVCPTGIDIRNGIQYQCIDCGLCVDACNEIMEKMNYEPNLISYTTEKNLEGEKTKVLRPRLFGYSFMAAVMVTAFIFTLAIRPNIELDIIRDRSVLFKVNNEGLIENSYTLKVMNKTQKPADYLITIDGLENIQLEAQPDFTLRAGEVGTIPVTIAVDPQFMKVPNAEIQFSITNTENNDSVTEESRFIKGVK